MPTRKDDAQSKAEPTTNNQQVANINADLLKQLSETSDGVVMSKSSAKEVSKEQVSNIIARLSKVKDISSGTAVKAIATLFRRGAAAAAAPDSMQVEVKCPSTGLVTDISRYDVVMALHNVCDHKTLRKLAEAMAPEMVQANLTLLKANPLLDLKGDLANRINRKLVLRKEDPLSREEEICCCTYAQWMPNLNEMANSNRLKALLEEDLAARRKQKSKKGKKGSSKPNQSQVKK